jgi:hypothetical protein
VHVGDLFMPPRNLRIVKREPPPTIGICEYCNQQFKSHLPQPAQAEWEIKTEFDRHKCKRLTPAKPLPGS